MPHCTSLPEGLEKPKSPLRPKPGGPEERGGSLLGEAVKASAVLALS